MKKSISLIVALVVALAASSFAAEGELTVEKKSDIKKLLDMTGALNIGQQMSGFVVKQMTETIQKTRPDIPSEMFDILLEEVNKTIAEALVAKEGGFIELVIPIYHKHLSHDEIKGLIAFYQTELGQKALRVLPTLVQESMTAGQRWGQELGPVIGQRVIQRFKEKGIDLSGHGSNKDAAPDQR
jgi:hypothetical protein